MTTGHDSTHGRVRYHGWGEEVHNLTGRVGSRNFPNLAGRIGSDLNTKSHGVGSGRVRPGGVFCQRWLGAKGWKIVSIVPIVPRAGHICFSCVVCNAYKQIHTKQVNKMQLVLYHSSVYGN